VEWNAYRVSLRQTGRRNVTVSSVPVFLCPDMETFISLLRKVLA